MASKMRSMRLDDEVWSWLAEEAGRLGTTRTGVVQGLVVKARALESALGGAVCGDVRGAPSREVGSSPGPASSRASGVRAVSGRPGVRVDTTSQAREWAAARQARLNAEKERAS